MTKEEKIKEEWGLSINSYTKGNNSGLRNDGWSCVPPIDDLSKYDVESEACHDLGVYDSVRRRYRPKTLKGIENNNGWVKIESEDDLPQTGTYWVIRKDYETPIRAEIDKNNRFDIAVWKGVYTHYQPIEKPKPPIY